MFVKLNGVKIYEWLKRNKLFLGLIALIFVLHVATYPCIHNLTDETKYLEFSEELCQGNFSYFSEDKFFSTPFYFLTMCVTSPLHGYVPDVAELVTFGISLIMVATWYFSVPKDFDRKKLALLLFSNSLIWIYSFRVMMDIPVAFFLSLGMLHLYLFLERNNKKNYYISFALLTLAIFTKEIALLFVPIFLAYLLIKRDKNWKKWILVLLPLIPYLVYLMATGPEEILWLLGVTSGSVPRDYSYIPYGRLPVILFLGGVFGTGIISVILAWKNYWKEEKIKNFILLTFVSYIVWEGFFSIIMPVNLPRYSIALIPFFSVLISEYANRSKKLLYIYYLTLAWSIITGFLAGYYFHVIEGAIWEDSFKNLIDIIKFW